MSISKTIIIFGILFIAHTNLFSQTLSATIKGGSCETCLVLYVKSQVDATVAINNFNITVSVDDVYNPTISINNPSLITEGHQLSTVDFDYPGKNGSSLISYQLNGRRYYDIIYHNSSTETINDNTILLANVEHPLIEIQLGGLNNHSLVEAKVQFNDMTNINGGNNMQSYWYASIAGNGNDGSGTISALPSSPLFYSSQAENIVGVNAANDQYIQLTNFIKSLPVTFISVGANAVNNKNIIVWSVTNDAETKQYIVERSANGTNFNDLVVIKKRSNATNYNCTDEKPLYGDNFYRIKAVGFNGENIFSEVVKVAPDKVEHISLYPNPVTSNGFNIEFQNTPLGTYQIAIYDLSGKIISLQSFKNETTNISQKITWDKNFPHAHYSLKITKPDNNTLSYNFIY